MKFKGKVVLVTGASRGIGRAIALTFGREGASVIINYVNAEAKANGVVKEIKKAGSKAMAIRCDVSDEFQVEKMVEGAVKEFGKIDILVNNAGIVYDIPFLKKTTEQWRRTIDVDLMGVYFCSRHVGMAMKEQKRGNIINISSTNGISTIYPETMDYDAAKAGVISMTKNLATALAPNIRVNCIAPGWVATDINAKLPKKYIKEETARIPMGRFGKPEEIAKVALFLASDDASFMSGSIVTVDGGYQ